MFAFATNYEVRPVAPERKPAPAQERPKNTFDKLLKNTANQGRKNINTLEVKPEKLNATKTNEDNNLLIASSPDNKEELATLATEPVEAETLASIEGLSLEEILAQAGALLEDKAWADLKSLNSQELELLKTKLAEVLNQNAAKIPLTEVKMMLEEIVTKFIAAELDATLVKQENAVNPEDHAVKNVKAAFNAEALTLARQETNPKKTEGPRLNENKLTVENESHRNTTDIKRLMATEANRFNGIKSPTVNVENSQLLMETSTKETNDSSSMLGGNLSKLDAATLKLDNQFASMVNKQVEAQELIDQIVKKVDLLIKQNASEIKIDLKPEFLGRMTIKLVVEEGILTARFLTENQQVKHLLESNLNSLRQSLEAQGIRVEKAEVNVQLNNGGLFDGSESGKESKGEEAKFVANYLPRDPEENLIEAPTQFINSGDGYQEALYESYENPSLSFLI